MNACQIVEVINGREKGVIDPRYPIAPGDIESLVAVGVNDITVRRPPTKVGRIESLRIVAAETFLRRAGWEQWCLDPYVWLRPERTDCGHEDRSWFKNPCPKCGD